MTGTEWVREREACLKEHISICGLAVRGIVVLDPASLCLFKL